MSTRVASVVASAARPVVTSTRAQTTSAVRACRSASEDATENGAQQRAALALPDGATWPTNPNDLWTLCGLPPVADLSYATLAPEECAHTSSEYNSTSCQPSTVAIDKANCNSWSVCCALIHESQHVAQAKKICDLCAAQPGGRSFSDCVTCYHEGCEARMEAAGYHTACQVSSACGPGGTGAGGTPPEAGVEIPTGGDPGLQCFGEWKYCKRVLDGGALPAACGSAAPFCNAVVNNADVVCNCGTAADATYGCELACANGTCGRDSYAVGKRTCKCNNPTGKCKTLTQNEVPCTSDDGLACTKRKLQKGPCAFDRLGNCVGSVTASCDFASNNQCVGVSSVCYLQ